MSGQKKEAERSGRLYPVVVLQQAVSCASLGHHLECHGGSILRWLMKGLDLFHFGVRLMAVGENVFWESDLWICPSF